MARYNPKEIEAKWQKIWEKDQTFKASEDVKKPKMYLAEMFPYPSGAGLHVGHVRNFTIVDVLTRFYTQQEMNVLRPFGYDTFGLPAENYAIKTGISPQSATKTNIENFRKQLKRLGYAIDWSREINTSDPEYYRWTQWCFLQLYKKGLAYRKESYQWWCPVDQTVLANEQVENGHCWRCGSEVEKKKMKQWFFKITDYADELLADIDQLDWPDKIKTMQRNWIGRSEGAEIDFEVAGTRGDAADESGTSTRGSATGGTPDARSRETSTVGESVATGPRSGSIKVFTTRPDTVFGATFLVLAPEHPLVRHLVTSGTREKVDQYREETLKKSEIERQENKEKTGVFTGSYAINPATGEKIPIWIADYVLLGYGEGAIMAVPDHDERDYDFAKKFDLPIQTVVEKPENSTDDAVCYHGEGKLVSSGQFNGIDSYDAREQVVAWLEQQGVGKHRVTYRMRDWLISRQRYWGCPIPIAYDKDGNEHPIPEDQLPVIIPEVKDYKPDNTGRSALAKAKDWLTVELLNEKTGKIEKMTRETDTLDGYACSSWYLWRYTSPRDDKNAWNQDAIKYWAPTDIYVGADHAVAHLLYVRFWCKFFADQGLLSFREPAKTLLYNGYINAPDGKKMSKSKGNVIDPLDVIDQGYGADTLRTYEMFIGPYDQDAAWDPKSVGGVYRFLNRCWTLCFGEVNSARSDTEDESDSPTSAVADSTRGDTPWRPSAGAPATVEEDGVAGPRSAGLHSESTRSDTIRHKTIKKVTEDLYKRNFNTAVAALMEYVNELYKIGATKDDLCTLAKLLKPFAPHLASEMLEELESDDVWPTWDEDKLTADTALVIVQVNGKLRAKIEVNASDLSNQRKIEKLALSDENVKKYVKSSPKKIIYVKRAKILNIVV